MAVTSDEIGTLRKTMSDDDILSKLKEYAPTDAGDIGQLQKNGMKSGDILDKYTAYHQQYPEADHPVKDNSSISGLTRMGQGLAYGVAQEAHALGETAKSLGSSGSWSKSVEDAANTAGNLLGPMDQYKPASAELGIDPHTWGNIPRAIVEGLPMVGGMALAGAAAPEALLGGAAGLAGAGAYGLARNLGTTADARAVNNGHSMPTTSDVVEALPGAALRGLVDAAGNRMLMKNGVLAPNPVTGAGAKAMAQTGLNLGKATATNAATGAASDAIGQAGEQIGTNKGYTPDVAQSLHAGVVGGLTAAGMKAAESIPQSITNYRLSGTPDAINRQVADDLMSNRITGDPTNPADHERLVTGAKAIYNQDIATTMKGLTSTAKEIDAQGGSVSHINDAMATAKDLMTNLQKGPLDASQVKDANDKLAGQPGLLNQILKLNKISSLGEQSDIGKGGSPTAWDYFKAWKAYKAAAGVTLAMSGHPLVGGLIAGAPFALTAADRIKAGMSGSSHLIGDFAQRFGGQNVPQESQGARPTNDPRQAPSETPNAPQEAPQAPHAAMLQAPRPQLTLPRPPIYAGSDPSWSAHQGFQMEGEPYTPQEAPREPQAPLALPPPMRQLPAPPMYASAPTKGFRDQTGAEMSDRLLMLRAALQKTQGGNQAQAPAEAAPEPPAPQTALQMPVDTKAVAALALQRQRAMQALAAKEFAARQKPAENAKEPAAPPQPTFNDQANAIEKQITDAQAVIKDPTSSPEAVAMAKAAVRKAAIGAANQHDASHGGSKGVKKAAAPHAAGGSSHEHAGSEKHSAGAHHVTPEMTHIHTKVGEKVQATAHIRKSADAVGQGVVKSRGTRFEIADTAKHLALSSTGKAHVVEAMEALKSKAESKATNNRAFGQAALAETLKGFNEHDRAILQHHFDTARSTHGIRFLDSWTHATPEAKASADVKNAGFAKAKATIAAKADKASPDKPVGTEVVEKRIRDAFFQHAGSPPKGNVRLSKIRESLRDIPREDQDKAMLSMRDKRTAQFMNLDNPRDIAMEKSSELQHGPHPNQVNHIMWIDQ